MTTLSTTNTHSKTKRQGSPFALLSIAVVLLAVSFSAAPTWAQLQEVTPAPINAENTMLTSPPKVDDVKKTPAPYTVGPFVPPPKEDGSTKEEPKYTSPPFVPPPNNNLPLPLPTTNKTTPAPGPDVPKTDAPPESTPTPNEFRWTPSPTKAAADDNDDGDDDDKGRMLVAVIVSAAVLLVGGVMVVVLLKRRSNEAAKEVNGTAELEVPLRVVSHDNTSSVSGSSEGHLGGSQSIGPDSTHSGGSSVGESGCYPVVSPTAPGAAYTRQPYANPQPTQHQQQQVLFSSSVSSPNGSDLTMIASAMTPSSSPFLNSAVSAAEAGTAPPLPPRQPRSKMPTSKDKIIDEALIAAEAQSNTSAFSIPVRCANKHKCEKTVVVMCSHGPDRKPKRAQDVKTLFDGHGSGHLWKCSHNSQLTDEERSEIFPLREMRLVVDGVSYPTVTFKNDIVTIFDALGTQLEFADHVINSGCTCVPLANGKFPKVRKVPVEIHMSLIQAAPSPPTVVPPPSQHGPAVFSGGNGSSQQQQPAVVPQTNPLHREL